MKNNQNNNKKIIDIYFDLFDIMMNYNHKLWRTIALPLPLNHLVVMYFLYNNKGESSTISEIANHLSISKQQMSPIIDKLLKKSFIEKHCLSNDRRYSQIYLTKQGNDFLEEHQQQRRLNFIQYMTDLSDEDVIKFDESVKNVKKMIKKMFEESQHSKI